MSQSVCKALFSAPQLARVLPLKTYALYERLIQAKEIDAAGLEGLEECPFCEWKCVFDVGFEGEKLFRCGNDVGGCGVVSCRKCKKLDHLPKSCEELENDKKLDARHLVEEAMSTLVSNLFYPMNTANVADIFSSSTHEELSKMQERWVSAFRI